MKLFVNIICISYLFLLFSCTENVPVFQNVYYCINRDSSILIYSNHSSECIELKKPINYQSAEDLFPLSSKMIATCQEQVGMDRYINGNLNDTYKLSSFTIAMIIFLAGMNIYFLSILFKSKYFK
jgi:hypothetical protein